MKTHEKIEQPKVILNCQMGYFSIAKYYGGIEFNGAKYLYIPTEDALIREDLVKKYQKLLKKQIPFESLVESL